MGSEMLSEPVLSRGESFDVHKLTHSWLSLQNFTSLSENLNVTIRFGLVQAACPNPFFGKSRLDFRKSGSDPNHIWRWFEIQFYSYLYRCVSV